MSEVAVEHVREPVRALAPHRQCVGCGYDIVGLALAGRCTECDRPVRDTLDRFMLRSDARAAAGIARARLGGYGLLLFLGLLLLLMALAVVSVVVPGVSVERVVDSLGSERFTLSLCALAVVSASLVTSGFCAAPKARRLGLAAVALTAPILALPVTVMSVNGQSIDDHLVAGLVALGLLGVSGMVFIFVYGVRSASLACDDYACHQQMRRWTWIPLAWVALVAVPAALLLLTLVATKATPASLNWTWVGIAFRFYFVGLIVPLTLLTIATALLLTIRMLKVAKRELACSSRISS